MPEAARLGGMDEGHECFPPTAIIARRPAVRVGDSFDTVGAIAAGSPDVLIG